MIILPAGKRDATCGHAAVVSSRSVLRHDPARRGDGSLPRRAGPGVAQYHTRRRVMEHAVGLQTDAHRCPSCHVAQATVAVLGVSIAHIGGDKSLVLCLEE